MKKTLVSILMILTMFSLWSCQEKPDSPVNAELQSIEFTNIDGNTLYMREGETFKVNYALEPSELEDEIELQWKTNRKFIVSVEDGKLTAHTEGTAEITAYYGDVSASFTVEVAEYIELETITMSLSKSSIAIGETSEATLKLNPETASDVDITWEVSPEGIVSLSNEEKNKSITLTGLNPGTVTVTAKDVSGLKASKTLTVSEVDITSISLSSATIALCPDGSVSAFGSKTHTLSFSTVPANQEHQLEWISSNPSAATVENGVITAVGHGYTQIKAKAPNGVESETIYVMSVTNSGANWKWKFYLSAGDDLSSYNSPSTIYSSIGSFAVKLVDANLSPVDEKV
ncbi:MAG: Ig-like domain-containing protein, partial [Bacteroidales bacterium]|nr:Ig-like domain-containing protein [Bacteroidales bacterium]